VVKTGRMLQVLLVDDDPGQLRVRELLLRSAGIEAMHASDAEEALACLNTQLDSIGAVVTDHRLPGRSGVELVRELRRIDPSLPVLVLSGMPGIEDEYEGLETTVRTKPLPSGQFVDLVRQLLRG
jgi:DNA-binding response OmpR family regulator